MLDNTTNQPSKFKVKNWTKVNDDAHGTYSTNIQTKFKNSMLKSSLSNYSDAYIRVSRTTAVPNTGTAGVPNNRKI